MNSASTDSFETVAGPREKGRGWALARYVVAATLVRSADGGAVVAIVLLAHASGLPGWIAGLLGASITAPHLLGPFIAGRLDTAQDGRKVIAISALVHGVLLGAAGLLLPVTWAVAPAVLLVVSGLFGPMLTGGVSSRLPSIAGPSQRSQRRAHGWDVASYGLSGTLGPAVVAWIAAGPGPLTATLVLAAAAIIGAGGVLVLPRQDPPLSAVDVPSPGRTLLAIGRSGPLRRTLALTITVAFSVAVLPIYAVAVAPSLGGAALAGTLVAVYGIGSLAGSALLMAWPLRGDSDRLTRLPHGRLRGHGPDPVPPFRIRTLSPDPAQSTHTPWGRLLSAPATSTCRTQRLLRAGTRSNSDLMCKTPSSRAVLCADGRRGVVPLQHLNLVS